MPRMLRIAAEAHVDKRCLSARYPWHGRRCNFAELDSPLTSLAGSLRLVSDWEEQQQGYDRLRQHGQEVLHAVCSM